MALDGPHDDDAAADAFRGYHPERSGFGVDRAETRGRDECYDDLRSDQVPELRSFVYDRDDAPRKTADAGWKWKGLELDPEANRIADEGIAARREAEGRDAEGNYQETGITPDMWRIEAELEHGTLVPDTEKFALKSPDRFKEKLAKLIADQPDKTSGELCHDIHDGIRYTFLFEAAVYSDGVETACRLLRDTGYELVVLKNTWANSEYRGINTRWLEGRSGALLEVQFHTPESWSAKQQTHDAYERISDLTTPAAERERLRNYQCDVASKLDLPDGWQDIEDYRREGW